MGTPRVVLPGGTPRRQAVRVNYCRRSAPACGWAGTGRAGGPGPRPVEGGGREQAGKRPAFRRMARRPGPV